MRNLNLRARLLIGFSAVFILLVTISIVLTGKLAEANARTGFIVNTASKRISLSKDLLVLLLDVTRQEKNIILDNEPDVMMRREDDIRKTLEKCEARIGELQELVEGSGAVLLEQFRGKWMTFRSNLEEIITLAKANDDAKAFGLSIEKGYGVREGAISTLELLIEKNETGMAADKKRSDESYNAAIGIIVILTVFSLLTAAGMAVWIIRGVGRRISFISREARNIASRENLESALTDPEKDELSSVIESLSEVNESFREIARNAGHVAAGNYSLDFQPRSEKDSLGNALKKMTVSLRESTAQNEKYNWISVGMNRLNESLRGDKTLENLSNDVLAFLCGYVGASTGALYLRENESTLTLSGKFAHASTPPQNRFRIGEGLIGQAAADNKPVKVSGTGNHGVRLTSAFIDAPPASICVYPFSFEGRVVGVIELGHLSEFSEQSHEFIAMGLESIAIGINSAFSRQKIQQLLEETQAQGEELQSQQEELKQMNEELEEQAQSLRQQQEELQMTNEELESQTQLLERKNREVEKARMDIEEKTRQLEVSSKYKSEFLANMSHELRTPLNSLLILSKDLSENKENNLSAEQIESAEIINKCGVDLLALINEVLDLSKIEAGKMTIEPEPINLADLVRELQRNFKHQAGKKGLKFTVNKSDELPPVIVTDRQRLNQIVTNLLSNAIKFTEKGEVSVQMTRQGHNAIAFAVTDTGIGIPAEKQLAIFEAFQQADGGTSRKYGGTGLGLSISKELARLLQGHITIESTVGKGSTFTLFVPIAYNENTESAPAPQQPLVTPAPGKEKTKPAGSAVEDDRNNLSGNDKAVLIIEDDPGFATILRNQARKKGLKAIVASTGEEGLLIASEVLPIAIILDLDLPGINGHQVLAELKTNPRLRHIPVHIISVDERTIEPIKNGAIEFLTKPVDKTQVEAVFRRIEDFHDRRMKNLLIVEDDSGTRLSIRKLIGNGDVKSFEAANGEDAIGIYSTNHIDCIVLDIGLPDISGFDLIQKLMGVKPELPPVIVYTGRELTKSENEELQKYAKTIIIKGTMSEERLLDETALFLHRTIDSLPEQKQQIIISLYDKHQILRSKNVLVVDDDMRNVFALSRLLREQGMSVIKAENGRVAVETLDKNPKIDIVLMDIMMPEMDGYEAMRAIRSRSAFEHLPIIALTAKAMKEDRQKCIDAGANDYITKPIDVDRLLSLMSVWLTR